MKNEKWPSTTSASSVTAKGTAMKNEKWGIQMKN